jgi:hypothetical protein
MRSGLPTSSTPAVGSSGSWPEERREAAARIGPDVRNAHAEVPWQRVTGMRNLLVHRYFDIDLDVVW